LRLLKREADPDVLVALQKATSGIGERKKYINQKRRFAVQSFACRYLMPILKWLFKLPFVSVMAALLFVARKRSLGYSVICAYAFLFIYFSWDVAFVLFSGGNLTRGHYNYFTSGQYFSKSLAPMFFDLIVLNSIPFGVFKLFMKFTSKKSVPGGRTVI
jgi:hypothetical protein